MRIVGLRQSCSDRTCGRVRDRGCRKHLGLDDPEVAGDIRARAHSWPHPGRRPQELLRQPNPWAAELAACCASLILHMVVTLLVRLVGYEMAPLECVERGRVSWWWSGCRVLGVVGVVGDGGSGAGFVDEVFV